MIVGVIFEDQRFVEGVSLPVGEGLNLIEWRNRLFERCDGQTMSILPEAQRQPRPWK
jgi:hypothetical protein